MMSNKPLSFNWLVLISFPFLLYGTMLVMPTFDDWTTLSSPNYDTNFIQYFLPFGNFWRPFDALMGYVNGIDSWCFPALNHILICLAHLFNTILVYVLGKLLGLRKDAASIASAFFYFSPCMLATVLSVDALNQSYSQLFSLLSVYFYLSYKGKKRYVLWLSMVLCATFCKENGLAWSIVAPVIAFAFDKIDKATFRRHIAIGLAFALLYAIVHLCLPMTNNGQSEHIAEMKSLSSKISGTAKWLGYTFTATDFLALIHHPDRNILLVLLTSLLSIPFIVVTVIGNVRVWRRKETVGLVVAIIIAASPNLMIAMSLMNAYCSLALVALLIGWLTGNSRLRRRYVGILFCAYLAAAFITDTHHWYMAWKTSLPGIGTARKVVWKMKHPVNNVYSITIKDDYPKYSSFCVPFDEAYGWGRAVWYFTGYKWPQNITDTIVDTSVAKARIMSIARQKLRQGYDCVWIASKNDAEVIRK